MNKAKARGTAILLLLLAVGLFVVPSGAILSQTQDQAAKASTQQQADQQQAQQETKTQQEQSQADKSVPPAQDQSTHGESAEKDEVKITPRQAEELFHSVDEILEFDSKQTGLPIKREIKRKLIGRDEVVSFLTKHLDDEDTKRLRRSELVLKKFGLLPRDFNLQTFLVSLLREEVAGYYDPKTRTVNLLDWVPMEEQEPVMAHELTHALQDQSINLQKWMKKGDKDLGEIRKDPTPLDIENDEIDSAREAVIEGQAQAIMFQYAIAPTGHSIANSPELVDSMVEETLTGSAGTKVFNSAPIFMKESLTFPYGYGLNFVVQVLRKSGKDRAFTGVLQNPPHTTRQIMEPETYLAGEKIEPLRVPDFKHDFKGYQKFDIGAMGEFDVAVLIEQYEGKAVSKKMYPEWRGGYYYAAMPRQDPGSDVVINGPLGLLYVSRWSSGDKAAEFASIYAHALRERYKKVEAADARVPEPGAQTESGDTDVKTDAKDDTKVDLLKGRHTWATEDGTVVIEEQGDMVFVSESLDAATTATLEKEVFATAPPAR